MVSGLALTLVMCSKENDTAPSGPQATAYNPGPKIRAFINSATHPVSGARDQVLFTTDEAEWNVEAALNYFTIDPTAKNDDLKEDVVEWTTSQNDNKIPEGEVYQAYNELLALFLNTPLEPAYRPIAIDVMTTIEGEVAKFTAVRISGKEPPAGVGTFNTDFTDPYYCRPNPNTTYGCGNALTTADIAIQTRINQYLMQPIDQYTGLTDVEIWRVVKYAPALPPFTQIDLVNHIIPSDFFPNAQGSAPHTLYRTFLTDWCNWNTADCEPCIAPQTMSTLTTTTLSVMDEIRTTYCAPQLVNIASAIEGRRFQQTVGQIPEYIYQHSCKFIYGRYYTITVE